MLHIATLGVTKEFTFVPCYLSSGLSPSVLEFHQINLSSTQERVLVRLADYHRRFGITPTPEHVLVFIMTCPHGPGD